MIKELPESLINNSTTNLVEYTQNLQIGNNPHLKPHKIPVGVLPTGKAPIGGVRWVDVNKGDRKAPLYRSRLVAKEFKRYKDDD